jgi:hypothetical protein
MRSGFSALTVSPAPFWRMFAKSIGSIGSVMRRVATYHSTSRARIMAGLSGFLILSQCRDCPD